MLVCWFVGVCGWCNCVGVVVCWCVIVLVHFFAVGMVGCWCRFVCVCVCVRVCACVSVISMPFKKAALKKGEYNDNVSTLCWHLTPCWLNPRWRVLVNVTRIQLNYGLNKYLRI